MNEIIIKIKLDGHIVECEEIPKLDERGNQIGYVYIEISQGLGGKYVRSSF